MGRNTDSNLNLIWISLSWPSNNNFRICINKISFYELGSYFNILLNYLKL